MNAKNIVLLRLAVFCTLVLLIAGCKKEENGSLTFLTPTPCEGNFTVAFKDIKECLKKHPDRFPDSAKILPAFRKTLKTDQNGIITPEVYRSRRGDVLLYTLIQDNVPMVVRCSKCEKEIPTNEIIESRSKRGNIGGLYYKDNQGHILLFVVLWKAAETTVDANQTMLLTQ